ncbi:MAG: DsbA family oxidoreductase [Deltaproteobacteria bacterium]|nr:DsbA family oxidoreductase [Deltaproteobacteria bacterium]
MNKPQVRVDIVSDVVCPWCVIGYRQLAQAAEQAKIELEIHWHPFELNPGMAHDGENLNAHLRAKYRMTAETQRQMTERVSQAGAAVGFDFRFSDDMRMSSTGRAHQVLHWAGEKGRKHALKTALFARYFTDHLSIHEPEVLADAAESVGLDRDEALAVARDGRFAGVVRDAQTQWREQGITGVPAMIFDEEHLVTGAQGTENYGLILKEILAMRTRGEARSGDVAG